MAVNNRDKKFHNIGLRWQHKYCGNLLQYPRISRVKITMVIYSSILYYIGTRGIF
jgi:hypothetical protein